jgi:hypothetical protein
MTLVEALVQKLRGAGVEAYALDSPDDKNTTVTVTPYMSEVVGVDQGSFNFSLIVKKNITPGSFFCNNIVTSTICK